MQCSRMSGAANAPSRQSRPRHREERCGARSERGTLRAKLARRVDVRVLTKTCPAVHRVAPHETPPYKKGHRLYVAD